MWSLWCARLLSGSVHSESHMQGAGGASRESLDESAGRVLSDRGGRRDYLMSSSGYPCLGGRSRSGWSGILAQIARLRNPLQPADVVEVTIEAGNKGYVTMSAGERDQRVEKIEFTTRGTHEFDDFVV